jgi:hypothetical protein
VRYRRHPQFKPLPEDKPLVAQLTEALVQTKDIPDDGRWRITMELLPDEFLYKVVLARQRPTVESALNLYALLTSVVRLAYEGPAGQFDEQTDMRRTTLGLIALPSSCLAELERRYKQFCDDVILMSNPLDFELTGFIQYVPRDPENFNEKMLADYYIKRSKTALS